MSLSAHPAAELFPLMEGEAFEALVTDIREHGQREPVVLCAGQILDGRNRYRACQQIGIEVDTTEWCGSGTPEAFVISKNLHRRHLNESQRAVVAAKLAALMAAEKPSLQNCSDSLPVSITRAVEHAADALNVSPRSVFKAKRVLAEGTLEDVTALERGTERLSAVDERMARAAASAPLPAKSLSQNGQARAADTRRVQAEMWTKLRSALEALAELPRAGDVAEATAHFARRLKFPLKQHIQRTRAWLDAFEESLDA